MPCAGECGHCAFDLLELDGRDLRREPIEKRKALLAKLLRGSHLSLVLNESLGAVAASDESQELENATGRAGAMQSTCARIYKDSYALEKISLVSLRLLEAGAAFFCSLRLEVATRAKELSLWRSAQNKGPDRSRGQVELPERLSKVGGSLKSAPGRR